MSERSPFRELYQEKGYSQRSLAEESGVSRPTLRSIERGEDLAWRHGKTYEKLALELDMAVSEVVSVIEETKEVS